MAYHFASQFCSQGDGMSCNGHGYILRIDWYLQDLGGIQQSTFNIGCYGMKLRVEAQQMMSSREGFKYL